jgi:hypothetical protein
MPRRLVPALIVALAVVLLAGRAPGLPALAQPRTPEAVLAAALASLESHGYVVRFTGEAANAYDGEMRYQSPLAYSLLVEDDSGGAFEYVFLEPVLYTRRRSAEDGAWSGWQQRQWHPDLPIPGLIQYHPRLPLELLRAARDLRAVDDGAAATTIEGRVSYLDALAASYEDQLAGPVRSVTATATLPLTVHLDAAGAIAQMALHLTLPMADQTPPSVLTFEFVPDAVPSLAAPAKAEEAEPYPFLRPGPSEPVQSLPLTVHGEGTEVQSAPFIVETGSFTARLEPAVPSVQYRIWRVKRGRQLLAGVGAIAGIAGMESPSTLALPTRDLPPGEYVLELTLPEPISWTLTIEDVPADMAAPLP